MANSQITIQIISGVGIQAAFEEAIRLAKLLNVVINFDFNGVKCSARSDSDVRIGVSNYNFIVKKETDNFRFAVSHLIYE